MRFGIRLAAGRWPAVRAMDYLGCRNYLPYQSARRPAHAITQPSQTGTLPIPGCCICEPGRTAATHMTTPKDRGPAHKRRPVILAERRNAKMARSAHAYMRGNTVKFYEWLDTAAGKSLPEGPPGLICGDCPVGHLGPVGRREGRVNTKIRDRDQTVIGNPVHDLIRLGLSLATAARSSDLPGVTTARMIEEMMVGYSAALQDGHRQRRPVKEVKSVHRGMQAALKRRWRNLAEERIEDVRPSIPRGDKFWDVTAGE